ncbi:MAG: lipocalin family protein [Methylococcales bacterium]
MKFIATYLSAILALLLTGCTGIPEGVSPVTDFQINRYLGTWYEIARLDHPFERGLNNISATYSLRDDGGIDVLNKGWSMADQNWSSAEGIGYFVEQPSVGMLKVSFFGPFYASYNIIELDKPDYRYAVVTGPDKSYLWILARDKQLPNKTLQTLITQAQQKGYATEKLIFVSHDR